MRLVDHLPRSAWLASLFALVLACGGRTSGESSSDGSDSGTKPVDAAASPDAREASCSGGSGEAGPPTSHVPANHRPAGSACPQDRAPKTPVATCQCPADGGFCSCSDCTTDSDCTKGPNGRCGQWIPPPVLGCSYDECFQDSDCEGGAPCECRSSGSSSAPNVCVTGGNCTVDSECGPGGYCSPSVLTPFCSCPSPDLCPDSGADGACYVGGPGATGTPPGPGWTQVPCSCGDSCGHGYFCHTPCDTCLDDSDCGGQGSCNYDKLKRLWRCSGSVCG